MRYKTIIDEQGNKLRLRFWNEDFIDESSGDVLSIQRHALIKFNDNPVRWYSLSELKKMSKKLFKSIAFKEAIITDQ